MPETKQLPTRENCGSIPAVVSVRSSPAVVTPDLSDEKRRALKNAIPALKNLIKCFEILIDETK